MWTLDELRAVTDTAHALDTPTIAHCRNAEATRLAAEAGVDLILHASFIDERALEAVVEAGCAIAPTFTFLANLADHGAKVGGSATQVDLFRGEIEATATRLRAAHDAGVPILSGSESGFALTPYGHWHAREMEVLVEAMGLTPLEAIRCATYNGARALRMDEGTIGVIAPGAAADVLVVRGDPVTGRHRARRSRQPVPRHIPGPCGGPRPPLARARSAARREDRPVGHELLTSEVARR